MQLVQTKGRLKPLKTVEEITNYIEAEIAESHELHDQAKGKDASQAFAYLLKATVLMQLLEEITSE